MSRIEEIRAMVHGLPSVDDPGDTLLEIWSQLQALKREVRDVEELVHSAGVEAIREHGDVEIGEGKALGFSYTWTTDMTDRYGAIEMLLERVGVPIDQRGELAEALDTVLPKTRSGPFVRTGLEALGVNTAPLYVREKRIGKDGEPVARLAVKDSKYMKQPKDKGKEEAA